MIIVLSVKMRVRSLLCWRQQALLVLQVDKVTLEAEESDEQDLTDHVECRLA